MTNDEKLILKKIGIFVGIKVALMVGVHYTTKALLRKI